LADESTIRRIVGNREPGVLARLERAIACRASHPRGNDHRLKGDHSLEGIAPRLRGFRA
jgi:hypothetical protein